MENRISIIRLHKVLTIVLAVAILIALTGIVYAVVTPKPENAFTEFYILGHGGKAEGYPEQIRVGEEASLVLVIVNHEYEVVSYRVEVRVDGVWNNEVGPIMLAGEQEWEEMVGFTPDKAGDDQKVEFLLYKDGETEPYLKPLQLWVDVVE